MKEIKLDKKQSIALLNRALDVEEKMREIMDRHIVESHQELRRQLNQKVLDIANERGCSIWDICYNYLPDIDYETDYSEGKATIKGTLTLLPIGFEFEKDGWIKCPDLPVHPDDTDLVVYNEIKAACPVVLREFRYYFPESKYYVITSMKEEYSPYEAALFLQGVTHYLPITLPMEDEK